MTSATERNIQRLVSQTLRDIAQLPIRNTPAIRTLRRRLSSALKTCGAKDVMAAARLLIDANHRWVAYEILYCHKPALATLRIRDVESLGRGLSSWGTVDAFGTYIAGPAWLQRQISDRDVVRWTKSKDLWRRRSALVATVVLNTKSRGGHGDAARTLMIAERLVRDREPMIVKALSWALRSLAPTEPTAVRKFLDRHASDLPALVRRETLTKLESGVKRTPKRTP